MLKKNLLVASCVVVVGLFATPNVVNADGNNESSTLSPMLRTTVVRREFNLLSGQQAYVYFTTTNKTNFASKFLLKVRAENPENDFYSISYTGKDEILYNSNSVETIKYSPVTDIVEKDRLGDQSHRIEIRNYSIVPMKFSIGYTIGMHIKSIPCVDYSDIDFSL